ncbi:MAG: hypothetical protein LBO02_02905 [Holosporaceae bacterium]|jgi:hypothetical protein|nr:hypothetical protein [Holosporaceae bacterium]
MNLKKIFLPLMACAISLIFPSASAFIIVPHRMGNIQNAITEANQEVDCSMTNAYVVCEYIGDANNATLCRFTTIFMPLKKKCFPDKNILMETSSYFSITCDIKEGAFLYDREYTSQNFQYLFDDVLPRDAVKRMDIPLLIEEPNFTLKIKTYDPDIFLRPKKLLVGSYISEKKLPPIQEKTSVTLADGMSLIELIVKLESLGTRYSPQNILPYGAANIIINELHKLHREKQQPEASKPEESRQEKLQYEEPKVLQLKRTLNFTNNRCV